MHVTLIEARRMLSALLKRVRHDLRLLIEIMVSEEAMAEFRAVTAGPRPGEAVERLLTLRRRQQRAHAANAGVEDVSERVDDHLHGAGGVLP